MTRSDLLRAVGALKADLLDESGPRISTMRNYRFAILVYQPADEFYLRAQVHDLASELVAGGWVVLPIDLHKVLLDRIRGLGDHVVQGLIDGEKALAKVDRGRALQVLRDRLVRQIEGPDGLASDVAARIAAFVDAHPDKADRCLVLLGRAGALYPLFRCSALLKHLDGRTRGVPVVMLYPGNRDGDNGLSFMELLPADRDYRPRIYS